MPPKQLTKVTLDELYTELLARLPTERQGIEIWELTPPYVMVALDRKHFHFEVDLTNKQLLAVLGTVATILILALKIAAILLK
ncbi:MAG: hypothetical protein FJZ90_04890 [Chloroflexi bacterium]|nr:hypothetical protein [Chloroflexota bacterium]